MSKKENVNYLPKINIQNNKEKQSITNLKNNIKNNNNNDIKKNEEEEEKEENEEEENEEDKEEDGEEEKEEEMDNIKIIEENNTNIEEEKNNNQNKTKVIINLDLNKTNNDKNNKKDDNKVNNNNKNKSLNFKEDIVKNEVYYKLKIEGLEKENSELKASINQKEEEIQKISAINIKLRKNLTNVSSQVDILLKKANDSALSYKNKNKNKKNKNQSETKSNNTNIINNDEKESLTKEKQLKNSLSMIHYLTKENGKLRDQIQTLAQITPMDRNAIEVIQLKDNEIASLQSEKLSLKDELNKAKYADKTIEQLKKKIMTLNDTICRLNKNIASLKEEIKTKQNIIDNMKNNNNNSNRNIISKLTKEKKILGNFTKININTNKNIYLSRQRSSSLNRMGKGKEIKFCSTTKNFYKLFNESEQKAISTLFESEDEFNAFKQKIGILENRNSSAEKIFTKEIKDLKQKINEKDNTIKELNTKILANEVKIKVIKNKSKENNNNNNTNNNNNNSLNQKVKKKLNIKQQLKDLGYTNKINTKNEQIETMNVIIHNLREELNKYHIEKYKEKELNDIKEELQLKNDTKKFENSFLKVKNKEIQVHIDGTKNVENNKELKSVKIMRNIGNERKSYFSMNNNNNSSSKKINKTNTISSLKKGRKK